MDDALGDALVIEVGDLLAQDEVFEQRRPALARLERGRGLEHRAADHRDAAVVADLDFAVDEGANLRLTFFAASVDLRSVPPVGFDIVEHRRRAAVDDFAARERDRVVERVRDHEIEDAVAEPYDPLPTLWPRSYMLDLTPDSFGGQMLGELLVQRWQAGATRLKLAPDGRAVSLSDHSDDTEFLDMSGNGAWTYLEDTLDPNLHNYGPAVMYDTGKIAYIDDAGQCSFGELAERVNRFGNHLRSLGLQMEDRILIAMHDSIDWPVAFLGAIKAGIVPLPINTYLRPRDYLYYLNDSGAKACLVDVSLVKAIDEIRRHLNSVRVFGVLGGAAAGYERVEAGLDAAATERETLPRAPDDMAFWLYSSGSTGDPKGVVHTHDHLYWAAELCGLNGYGFRRDDVIGCPPKMFFAMGLGGQVYFPMRVGAATLVSATPITPKRVWQQWIKHRPTIAMAVPTLLAGMLQVAEKEIGREAARRACERLRFVNSAGEILPPALMQRWKDYTGSEVLDGVGTTEMTHLFVINRPGRAVPGSCGRIVEGGAPARELTCTLTWPSLTRRSLLSKSSFRSREVTPTCIFGTDFLVSTISWLIPSTSTIRILPCSRRPIHLWPIARAPTSS